jgi:hypothetical protein
MKHMYGNLWNFHSLGPICITTNSIIRKDNTLVMGAGIALQAKQRFPDVPGTLAGLVRKYGNRAFYLSIPNLFSFPTKHDWKDRSDIDLIAQSCHDIVDITGRMGFNRVFLPKPGCANGQLSWADVDAVISRILDDRFTVIIQ